MKRLTKYEISFLITAIILFLISTSKVIQNNYMIGDSNYPTIKDGSISVSVKVNEICKNEIYDLNKPGSGRGIVKRVVAIPGDTVEIKDGKLYINGVEDSSPFSKNADYSNKNGLRVVVPENEYFVLGDNRNVSIDSRYFGTVPEECIISKVLFTIY